MSENESFNLDAPAINNYVNLILQDMKNYQYVSDQRYKPGSKFFDAILALRHLLLDMPPKGKVYIISEVPELEGFNIDTIYQDLNRHTLAEIYEVLDAIFNKALDWLWPNLLELHMNTGKPAYETEGHLGNKPR